MSAVLPLPPESGPRRDRACASSRWVGWLGQLLAPVGAVLAAYALFSLLLLWLGRSPAEFAELVWKGAFGTPFSIRNTLLRMPALIFCALAVAVPAQLGLMVIGGEGTLVLAGLASAAVAVPFAGGAASPLLVVPLMAGAGMLVGAFWFGIAAQARNRRQVNEVISSLLLSYVGIAIMNFFVEGMLRDPDQPSKSSTVPVAADYLVGQIPGVGVHWGLAVALLAAVGLHLLVSRTTFGFAMRIAGGNPRAARAQGLPVERLVLAGMAIGGACAGLAGYFEVAAVQGRANASLAAGYGFTGILVSFMARHHPLGIVPAALLFAGLSAANGLVQRRLGLPDGVMLLLQSMIFIALLVSQSLHGSGLGMRLLAGVRGGRA
ncbi:MAG: ABC transporter permease [Proteobacteria bacterium]|nr:ABC transporter permease [Pseudomonadota bacterium]